MGKFLKPKQFNLAHYSKGVRHLKLLKDGFGDGRFSIGGEFASANSEAAERFAETM
jgi:hypothetical protein